MSQTARSIRAGDPLESVLDRLSPTARERLLGIARRREFEAGATLIQEGTDTPFLGILEHGRVALRMRVPEVGRHLTIVTIEPGELLGWSAMVPPFRATADAVATEPSRILAVGATELRDALAADGPLAAELPTLLLETVSRRLSASWTQLIDLFGTRALGPW
jgi:CRP/FNR family cyclic AMP-dependent transcriptional regulator